MKIYKVMLLALVLLAAMTFWLMYRHSQASQKTADFSEIQETYSMQRLDKKLKEHGQAPVGDQNHPFYRLTLAEIKQMPFSDWQAAMKNYSEYAKYAVYDDPDEGQYQGILDERDWQVLSNQEIDQKLKAGNRPPRFDPENIWYPVSNLFSPLLSKANRSPNWLFEA